MDIPCRVCGEPWDNDSLHEEAAESGRTYAEVASDFRSRGCLALTSYTTSHGDYADATAATLAGAAYDLLGDDMDGAASLLADYIG